LRRCSSTPVFSAGAVRYCSRSAGGQAPLLGGGGGAHSRKLGRRVRKLFGGGVRPGRLQSPGSSVAAVFCGGGAGGGGAAAVPAPLDVDGVPAHVYGDDSAHPCSLSGLPPPVHMAFPGSCGTPFPSPMYAELPRIYNTLHCAS